MMYRDLMFYSQCYLIEKRRIQDHDSGIVTYPDHIIRNSRNIVRRMEESCMELKETERYIIKNEILNGKKDKWYLAIMSSSTYYRNRDNAYRNYLKEFE